MTIEHKQGNSEHNVGTGVKSTDNIFVEEDIMLISTWLQG